MRIPQALKDKVIAEILPDEQVTKGGLIIPETASMNVPHATCKVLSVGEEVKNINAGDTILCNPNGGQPIYLDGVLMKCLIDGEIYATLGE